MIYLHKALRFPSQEKVFIVAIVNPLTYKLALFNVSLETFYMRKAKFKYKQILAVLPKFSHYIT